MTLQTQLIQFIPLNKLMASPRNVRRRDRKADIDALAASIAARGLLQNLCVVPGEGDRFEVDAGGRRLQALKQLARTGAIARDFPVPCSVIAREAGVEVSLTENVHRVPMDAMDEVDAFAALVSGGATPEQVAQRFGVTRRHVDQRLALAKLSPRIKSAWKRGDVSLEAARAFCLVEDHARQDAVFRSLGRPVTHAASVRARLMDGQVRAGDRLALFVGGEAYEAAGGKVLRDLFDPEAAFIEDPALLTKLALEKAEATYASWLTQGWSWVDLDLGGGRGEGLAATRFHPDWRDPTAEEQAELDRLSAEIDALDGALEATGVDDDPRWSTRDDLEAAYETIRQQARCWPPETMAVSGVMLSIDHEGRLCAREGAVRLGDQKRAEAVLRQRRTDDTAHAGAAGATTEAMNRASPLPKAVNRDLTTMRTRAIRQTLAGEPDVALALCVAAMCLRSLHRTDMTGISLAAHVRQVDDLTGLDQARAELEGRLPQDEIELLDWALDLSREKLLAVLAVLVAGSVDLAHDDTSEADLRKQAIADRLARTLDVDMNAFWAADLDFWVRLPKAALLAAFGESPGMETRSERARGDLMKSHAKLRKDELASRVAAAFAGTNYLPDVLVTPPAPGAFTVTTAGVQTVENPAVAAE